MNAHLIVAQVQTYMPEVPVVMIQVLLQEFLRNQNNKGRSEFVTISGIPDDTYYTDCPDNVITIQKMYYLGDPVSMNYTEEDFMAEIRATDPADYKAVVGQDRVIRLNFAVNTGGSNEDLIAKATVRTEWTIKTLPTQFENSALYFILFRIHQMPQYKDPTQAKNYYTMYEDAYEEIRYYSAGSPVRNIGSDL